MDSSLTCACLRRSNDDGLDVRANTFLLHTRVDAICLAGAAQTILFSMESQQIVTSRGEN